MGNLMKPQAMFPRKIWVTLAALAAWALSAPGFADDSEIYYSLGGSSTGPNVIFFIDNSGSMNHTVTNTPAASVTGPYVSSTTYASQGCVAGTDYFVSGSPSQTTLANICSNPSSAIQSTSLQCTLGLAALAANGQYTDNFARWTVGSHSSGWSATFHTGTTYATQDVACAGDYNPASPVSSPGNGHGYPAKTLLEWYNGLINLPALQALV